MIWAIVVFAALLDGLSTMVGLHLGLSESNPLLLESPTSIPATLFVLKGVVILFGYTVWQRFTTIVIPLGLLVPWTLAAVNNIILVMITLMS